MEFWVVAAATGAGYVAKHWQNLSGERDGSSNLSPVASSRRQQPDACQVFDKMPNPIFPLPNLAKRCLLDRDVDHVSGLGKQVDQDHTDEINGTQEYYFDTSVNRLHKFRAKNTNTKPFSSLKPLVLTGNNKDLKDHTAVFMEEKFFEPIGPMNLPIRPEQKFDKGSDMVSLFIGITIGILSTTVTTQHEIEHLNDLLEQAENMVRDLHDKLEKKDGFTLKKHGTESDGTAIDSPNPKAEKFELTSDIEAELEAELERLEENMKGCSLQRLSNVVEIDSDFEADMARGDLNLDTMTWHLDSQSESDPRGKSGKSNESTTNPIFTPNYAVSSIDLKIRLHEVIESNLQSRIKELESLIKDQNTSHSPDPQEEENSFWDFDHTRIESFSSTP
ncbi:hypothetical protein LXL04_021160 [Taraxacum kok-saghyz]